MSEAELDEALLGIDFTLDKTQREIVLSFLNGETREFVFFSGKKVGRARVMKQLKDAQARLDAREREADNEV